MVAEDILYISKRRVIIIEHNSGIVICMGSCLW